MHCWRAASFITTLKHRQGFKATCPVATAQLRLFHRRREWHSLHEPRPKPGTATIRCVSCETGHSDRIHPPAGASLAHHTRERTDTVIKHDRIESNPDVMFGKPVIKGTRVTVEQVLRKLGAGMATQDILRDHPRLTLDDIRNARA